MVAPFGSIMYQKPSLMRLHCDEARCLYFITLSPPDDAHNVVLVPEELLGLALIHRADYAHGECFYSLPKQ